MQDKQVDEQNKHKTESTEQDEFTQRFLDPSQLTFTRSEVGTVRLEIHNKVCHLRVIVRRLMPLSNPDQYISLATDEDTEIGILVNPSELAPENQKILNEELDKRYFTPTIKKNISCQRTIRYS